MCRQKLNAFRQAWLSNNNLIASKHLGEADAADGAVAVGVRAAEVGVEKSSLVD